MGFAVIPIIFTISEDAFSNVPPAFRSASFALGAPAALGQAKSKVVVIGGGAGGATAAKFIAKDSAGAIAATLVEPNETYQTCFHSNLYVGGFRSYDSITHRYDAMARAHGITLARATATAIDRDRKQVVLSTGARLDYDRLVVAPGIDLKYDSVPAGRRLPRRRCRMAGSPARRRG